MSSPFPWDLLEGVLGASGTGSSVEECRYVLRDGPVLGPHREHPQIGIDEYLHAVDRRAFRPLHAMCVGDTAVGAAVIRGRQVGTLGETIATGRSFDCLAHVKVLKRSGAPTEVTIESAVLSLLSRTGLLLKSERSAYPTFVRESPADREDLLNSDAAATHWARVWRLPACLARIAVMVMSGMSARAISARADLSLPSVHTYTARLFALANVHSRTELAVAALRAGATPARSD